MNVDRLLRLPDGTVWTEEKSEKEALREEWQRGEKPHRDDGRTRNDLVEFTEVYGRGVRSADPEWAGAFSLLHRGPAAR